MAIFAKTFLDTSKIKPQQMTVYEVQILFPTDNQDDCDFVKPVYVDKNRAKITYPDAEIIEVEYTDVNPRLN